MKKEMNQPAQWAIYPLSIGNVAIRQQGACITSIQLATHLVEAVVEQPTPLTDQAAAQLEAYLAGRRTTFDFAYSGWGTPFQEKVWSALCQIPYGETRSYKEIATAIGMPKASRAVGAANRQNPLLFVVPCHRVIAANGTLSGYAAGVELKQRLLTLEKSVITSSFSLFSSSLPCSSSSDL